MPIGLGADDDRGDFRIVQNRLQITHEPGPHVVRVFLPARRVVIPDRLDHQIAALLDPLDEAGRVNVSAADKSDVGHECIRD